MMTLNQKNNRAFWALACASTLALGLSACGGGGGDDTDPAPAPAPVAEIPQGIWQTPEGFKPTTSTVVTPDGKMWSVVEDGAQTRVVTSALSVQGSELIGQGTAYILGTGTVHPSTLKATSVPKSTLMGTAEYNGLSQAFSLGYQARYETPASLPALEGLWHDVQGPGEQQWNVTATGVITGTRTTGCTYVGQLSERPERKAVMNVSLVEDCGGSTVTMNGVGSLHPNGSISMVVITGDQLSAVALSWVKTK